MTETRLRVVVAALDDGGGMRHYAHNLGSALECHCDTETILIGQDNGLDLQSLPGRLLDLLPKGDRLRRFYNPSRGKRLANELMHGRPPHVVHLCSTVPSSISLISRLHDENVAIVMTVHDVNPHEEHRSMWGRLHTYAYQRWARPVALRQPDAIHVHSDLHRSDLANRFGDSLANSAYVVPHGGGLTEEIRRGNRRPPELEAIDDGYGLFFGRAHPYKGLPVLFEALTRIAPRTPPFRLVVAGSGRLPIIPQAAQSSQIVTINRHIGDDEIAALVRGASFVVLPYIRATQTGVVPIASALSKPAIVTTAGSLPEMVVDGVTGAIVTAGDVAHLAAALQRLVDDPAAAARMGEAARLHLELHFAWPVVAAHHVEAYRGILARREVRL